MTKMGGALTGITGIYAIFLRSTAEIFLKLTSSFRLCVEGCFIFLETLLCWKLAGMLISCFLSGNLK